MGKMENQEYQIHFCSKNTLKTIRCDSQLRKLKLHIAHLTGWHNSIFGYKLRTIEAENLTKVENSQPHIIIY